MVPEERIHARMVFVVLLALAILLGCVARSTPGHWTPPNPYPAQSVGYDVSWPNCEAKPLHSAYWGIVGVTGGLSLKPNPCLQQEASWFTSLSLYINSGYPGGVRAQRVVHGPKACPPYKADSIDEACLAYNYGYAEGLYAINLATGKGLHSTIWWIDVEIDNSWSDFTVVNRASLQGTYDALHHAMPIATIGYYSYPGQWDLITGHWHNGMPAWSATGELDYQAAVLACKKPSFTGGPTLLGQYTSGFDRNLAC